MHELSIANSILDLARQHMPAGAILQSVTVRAGPMRAIDRQAMIFAWRATTAGTDDDGAELELELLPWHLRCLKCGCAFSAAEPSFRCECGSEQAKIIGGDDLVLLSIEVDELAAVTGGAP